MISLDDHRQWDREVLLLPAPHVLQGASWGDFKARWGWSVHRFIWPGSTSLRAAAQVLVRSPGRLPLPVAYVPKGPLLAEPADPQLWRQVLVDLTAWARERGVVVLKIDPDIPAEWDAVAACWRSLGWRFSWQQIQFPNTMISDLTTGESGLLAAMKPKTRYNVRLAARRGVEVRHGGLEDLPLFHELYLQTGIRDGFAVREAAYYLDIWSVWLREGRGTLILAERGGQTLAGCLPVAFGATAWFLYGASADQGREHMASYLAQWESLRWALGRGCRQYDWWGAPTVLAPSDRLWGVYRFKAGFGAVFRPQLGAWDAPLRGPRSSAYEAFGRAWRAVAGWRQVRRTGSTS